ncbi:hypothetical protein LJB42_003199 [Komagataella kurtzmanii]|nr:hypothetical protein LJB42_003199 [Komagataella kurtzmanii]
MDTQTKLNLLKKNYPEVNEEVLLELLLSCRGSFKQTVLLLNEQFDNEDASSVCVTPSYQSSLNDLWGSNKRQRIEGSGNIMLYTKESIETTIPYVSYHKSFLPAELADRVLKYLLDLDICTFNEFYIAGKKCISTHKTCLMTSKDFIRESKDNVNMNNFYIRGNPKKSIPYNSDLTVIQSLIQDLVNETLAQRDLSKTPFHNCRPWNGGSLVCNRYDSIKSSLDWHSDRLTFMGPHPVIVSLSFGCTRYFRLRKIHPHKGSNLPPVYNIPVPHNTLLIMYGGCQEEYKHCVAPLPSIIDSLHPISGETRINLTYRHYDSEWVSRIPRCPECNEPMTLRRMFKKIENRGKYYWSCSAQTSKNSECKGFYWAKFDDYLEGKLKDYTLFSKNEDECSQWIAEDDWEKLDYLKEYYKDLLLQRKKNPE